ncbi:MAG TPA: hypothetical protein VIW70_11480 [Rubrivivax sp.]
MGWSHRKWWVWLLLAMLPLQGLAAATMALCDPAHHAHVAAAASGHADGGAHHAHDHAGEMPSGDAGTTVPAATGDAHKCSACASCCGAAVLHALPLFESAEPAPATFAMLAAKVEPFAAPVAERPPRRFPA